MTAPKVGLSVLSWNALSREKQSLKCARHISCSIGGKWHNLPLPLVGELGED